MKGSCIIDGFDIDDLGGFILRGGDYDFLSFPERRDPLSENWFEYDGVDVDLSEIFFKEKSLTVKFHIKGETSDEFIYRLNGFYKRVSAPGYRILYSREFDRTFRLRFVSCPEYTHRGGLFKPGTKRGTLSVSFSMDDPLQLFTDRSILEPVSLGTLLATESGDLMNTEDSYLIELFGADAVNRRIPTRVLINGYDLSRFGIIVTQCYNSVLRLSAAKQPLTRSFERMTGLQAFTSEKNTFDAQQITIECVMISDFLPEFYHNYEALFNNLTLTQAIQVSTAWSDSECYYISMTDFVKHKAFKNGIRISFKLNLMCITPGLIDFLLSTEDGSLILTEDEYNIDLS